MIKYATVGTNRLEEAVAFYDAVLALAGFSKMFDGPSGGRLYSGPDGAMFGVLPPHDGNAASVGNGTMIGFNMPTRAEAAAIHAKALEMGGTCEGPPGLRGGEEMGAYFAYFRDLDGNKLCAYRWGPE